MTDIIVGIAIGIVVTCWAIYFALKIAERRLERQIDELVNAVKKAADNIIQAKVEEHDGVYYIYNTRDDSFMAQGNTIVELRSIIESRWPNARVHVVEGDRDVIDRLRATAPAADMETDRA